MYFLFNQANNLISHVLWLRVKISLATREYLALPCRRIMQFARSPYIIQFSACLIVKSDFRLTLKRLYTHGKKQTNKTKQNNKQKRIFINLIGLSNRQK